MKYTIERIPEGEDEVILRYWQMTLEVERIWNLLRKSQGKLIGWKEKTRVMLDVDKILYIESVDSRTYAYTSEDVFAVDDTLNKLGQFLFWWVVWQSDLGQYLIFSLCGVSLCLCFLCL